MLGASQYPLDLPPLDFVLIDLMTTFNTKWNSTGEKGLPVRPLYECQILLESHLKFFCPIVSYRIVSYNKPD